MNNPQNTRNMYLCELDIIPYMPFEGLPIQYTPFSDVKELLFKESSPANIKP